MATEQKEKKTGKVIDISRAKAVAKELLGIAVNEVRGQTKLDRYQMALLSNRFNEDNRMKRINRLKEQAEKLDKQYAQAIDPKTGKPYERMSNWEPVAKYFNETLGHMKEEHFAAEADAGVQRDVSDFRLTKLTKDQENLIIAYHKARVAEVWERVLAIRTLLEYKGLLKKAPAKLPTEDELAQIEQGKV